MSPWLFNIYTKVGVWDLSARLNMRSVEQPLVAGLYIDDTVLLVESEGMLQRIVDEFDRICKRRKYRKDLTGDVTRKYREDLTEDVTRKYRKDMNCRYDPKVQGRW